MHMHHALKQTDHRPWNLPKGRWTWRQSWQDLLFAHWPVPADALRDRVPQPLEIEEFEGTSWIGLVPFRMSGVARRPLPDLPWFSRFLELNVRIYVTLDGKPGVWFLSLDAENPLAVWGGRHFFHLPYYYARMSLDADDTGFHYASVRTGNGSQFRARYRPIADVVEARPGTLERWLTERYCLYAQAPNGSIWRTEVHHAQWPLQAVEAEISENTLLEAHGTPAKGPPDLVHFSRKLDVVIWPPEAVT